MRGTIRFFLYLSFAFPVCARAQDSLLVADSDTFGYVHLRCKLPMPVLGFKGGRLPRQLSSLSEQAGKREVLMRISGSVSIQHFERNGSSDDLLLLNSASDIAILDLRVRYKDVYPVNLTVRYNRSRPFQLDNQYEAAISFDDRDFRQTVEQKIKNSVKNKYLLKQVRLNDDYEKTFRQYQSNSRFLQDPVYLQRIAEERLRNNLPEDMDGLQTVAGVASRIKNTSIPGTPWKPGAAKLAKELDSYVSKIPAVKKLREKAEDSIRSLIRKKETELTAKYAHKADSLKLLLKKLEDSVGYYKARLNNELDSVNKDLSGIQNGSKLKQYAADRGLSDSLPRSRLADIMMKTRLRLGKFMLRQSELTVNNIFLHGASVQYGNEKFIIVSGGLYDFAFRELYRFRNDTGNRKRSTVYSFKVGKTDGRNLRAFNFYIGKKTKDASFNNDLRTVSGYSVEEKFYITKNFSAEFEIAKSTSKENSISGKDQQLLKELFTQFNTKTIGIYSTLKAYLPKSKTDAEVSYKYWGKQFESFNAGQYFNPQNNMAAKVSQPLFNRKLYLAAGLRYTDFSTSSVSSNMRSKTLFASALATLRIKKWPVISAGYYPGSQLYLVDGDKLYEYFYYILNATVSYPFKIGKLPVQSVITYNKFLNRYTDSLVSGSQSYYSLYLSARRNRFGYLMNLSRQELDITFLNTIESGIDYTVRKLRIGTAVKWNRIDNTITRFGYSGSLGWTIGRFGTINLMYDKSFLPERTGYFIPVYTGQIQFIKPLNFNIWH